MKNFLLSALVLGYIFVISGCGVDIKYSNRGEFAKEDEQKRKEIYKKVLAANDIDTVNKFCLMFIDRIMTNSDTYKILEKMNPTDDFSKFFFDAIPILYYSYSPENYKTVPNLWRDKTDRFISDRIPYPLNSGEDKFRKWVKKSITSAEWYVFPDYSKEDPENAAKKGGEEIESVKNKYALSMAWVEEYNYSDFKTLDKSSKEKILSTRALASIMGRDLDNSIVNYLGRLLSFLENNISKISEAPSIKSLSDDTSFNEVYLKTLDIFKEYITTKP